MAKKLIPRPDKKSLFIYGPGAADCAEAEKLREHFGLYHIQKWQPGEIIYGHSGILYITNEDFDAFTEVPDGFIKVENHNGEVTYTPKTKRIYQHPNCDLNRMKLADAINALG